MDLYGYGSAADPLKPSLFELIAQEQLRDLLQPALKYVLAVFAQRYPRYLIRIVNRHEEFYAALMLVVERHYLRKHNASFAENFYGLKRRTHPYIPTDRTQGAVGGIPPGEKLKGKDIRRSLFFLIAVPYLRAKAQDYYEILGGGIDSDVLSDEDARQVRHLTDQSFKGVLRRAFKVLYPWMNTSYEILLFVYNMGYLFEKTPFYRPWLRLMNIELRRLGVDDFREAQRLSATAASQTNLSNLSLFARLRRNIIRTPQNLVDSLQLLLPTAIFFVKFLEWWYSPSSPARTLLPSTNQGPIIPPPRMLRPHPQGIPFDESKYGHCPICDEPWRNATALPSGYVFCYKCAYESVQKNGRCPVTHLPASVWQLRKVLV